jgi:hypothetical protein
MKVGGFTDNYMRINVYKHCLHFSEEILSIFYVQFFINFFDKIVNW